MNIDTAMKTLKQAANRSASEDMRTPEVQAALDFLARLPVRKSLIERFTRTLNISHSLARQSCLLAAYDALERDLKPEPPPEEQNMQNDEHGEDFWNWRDDEK